MTEHQAKLLEKAERTLAAAGALLREGFLDDAASRSYYAMFDVARSLLETCEMTYSKHSAVIAAFGKHLVKGGIAPREFHRYLIDAQERRLASDYGVEIEFETEEIRRQISQAGEMIAFAREHLGA